MNSAISILKRFLLFFLVPYIELVFLRFVISKKAIYEYLIILFSPGLVFYVLIPAAITLIAFMLLLDKKNAGLTGSFQKGIAAINIIFFVLFLGLSLHLAFLASLLGKQVLSCLWYGLGVVTFASSFFVLLNPKELWSKIIKFPLEVFFSLFAGSLFWLFDLSIHYLWIYLSSVVTWTVYVLLRFLGYQIAYGDDGKTLIHPLLTASIAPACSGLEGIFLFLFLFTLILVVDWEKYSFRKALAIYLAGILFMFALNILRVTVFFMAGIWAAEKWGRSKSSELFVWFFHANVGWIFYLIGIAIFFALLFRIQSGKQKNLS